MKKEVISAKSYLIRAIYEWLLDNDLTPYLAVDTSIPDVVVPRKYVIKNKIVLNVSPKAVSELVIDMEGVSFKTRFEGISKDIYVPIDAVVAIYDAQQNNRGLIFSQGAEKDNIIIGAGLSRVRRKPTKRPKLTLVKRGSSSDKE